MTLVTRKGIDLELMNCIMTLVIRKYIVVYQSGNATIIDSCA